MNVYRKDLTVRVDYGLSMEEAVRSSVVMAQGDPEDLECFWGQADVGVREERLSFVRFEPLPILRAVPSEWGEQESLSSAPLNVLLAVAREVPNLQQLLGEEDLTFTSIVSMDKIPPTPGEYPHHSVTALRIMWGLGGVVPYRDGDVVLVWDYVFKKWRSRNDWFVFVSPAR